MGDDKRMGRSWFRKCVTRTVLVHTRDDRSIRGLLTGVHADCLTLWHPVLLTEGPQGVPLELGADGEGVIMRDNVSWVQILARDAVGGEK